jgi:co-chaperonin GroES (HSP10)
MKNTTITPLFDRALLLQEKMQEARGIIIPQSTEDRSRIMKVIATGDCKAVKKGDRVFVAKYAGTEVAIGDEVYTFVCEYDILGVINE